MSIDWKTDQKWTDHQIRQLEKAPVSNSGVNSNTLATAMKMKTVL